MEKCRNTSCENEVKTKNGKYCSRSCSATHRFKGNQFAKGLVHTEATKKKQSDWSSNRIHSEETKRTMSISASGKKHSAERIEKHSNRMIGNSYGVGKQSFLGKKHTDEFKKKLSIRMKGHSYNKGRICSEETRKRQSEAASKREFTGSSMSNYYEVAGIKCQGSSEKIYLERLIESESELPLKCSKFIDTPYGKRQLDFEYDDRFIEIKSSWTFKFYKNSDQELKDKWITENIKRVEVIVI